MNADELFRFVRCLGEFGDRQGRGVGGKDAIVTYVPEHFLGNFCLHAHIFKDRLDDQVSIGQRGVIRRRINEAQHGVFLLLCDLAALDAFVDVVFDIGFTLVCGFLLLVDQHDFHSGLR